MGYSGGEGGNQSWLSKGCWHPRLDKGGGGGVIFGLLGGIILGRAYIRTFTGLFDQTFVVSHYSNTAA